MASSNYDTVEDDLKLQILSNSQYFVLDKQMQKWSFDKYIFAHRTRKSWNIGPIFVGMLYQEKRMTQNWMSWSVMVQFAQIFDWDV